ncbi:hypothetical protein HW115_19485 [Verrucomicrobiaceae bacterium N1E253]|uniref:Uncharacterized protein n=1 Tax=Oceaniferula marina TaxID=2748318 RepID=A0A851GPH7_9BACT|nr:hypothetical protein [Oceaniferula marina]NWK57811.1 hypothetical protein [Oceaniferula marina]
MAGELYVGQKNMTITDLVKYFRNDGSFEDFCKSRSLNADSEVIEIFARTPVSKESSLEFFEIEKTEGSIQYSHDSVEYRNLFDFYFFQDAIEESKDEAHQTLKDSDVAVKLMSYALNDA